ncbi:ATP-binding protein [Ideonella sp.]|uniref:ATP-binding protein n=1 Tax=Ideonella sp. TaxID=1929293 RepID=UPI003BB64613
MNDEAFLKRAGRIAGVGGWRLDLRSQTVEWSDQTCRILDAPLGFRPTLDQATSMYTAASRPIIQKLLDQALSNGTPWDVELEMRTAAGRLIWTRSVGEVETKDGKAVALAGAFQDISARKIAEAENLAAVELTRNFYDNAPCGYYSLGPDRTILRINDRLLSWLGRTREQVLGIAKPTDFMTPDSLPLAKAAFAVLMRDGEVGGLQCELLPVDGRRRHVSISATAIYDEAGNFVQTRSVMYDITELHEARQALAAQTAEQHAMLDSESVGMLRVRAGLIVWTNRGMDRIFGYERGDWDQMPIARLFDDETYYRATAARIASLAYGDGTFREDQHLLRKDGSRVWVDVSTIKSSPTSPESFTIVKDISDRKYAEVARLNAVELDAQNLALLEAGRLKDDFLANMSHELRTPLNAVIGFSQLLQMANVGADSPKHADYIRHIGESGQHLLQLVQTMLDFGKTASGKMNFSPRAIPVQAALDEVIAMLEPKRLAAGVEIVAMVEGELSTVVNDPLRLRQMVLNLAGNAVKFSKPGGAVTLRARGLNDRQWSVEVKDNGIGMDEEGQKRLFDRFVQLSAGSTKAYSGTGLGLSLVRMVARAQGGDVEVRSELGLGSTFTLVLPRDLAEVSPHPAANVV